MNILLFHEFETLKKKEKTLLESKYNPLLNTFVNIIYIYQFFYVILDRCKKAV